MAKKPWEDDRITTFGVLVEAHSRLERTLGKRLEERHDLPHSSFEAMLRIGRSPEGHLMMSDLASQIALTTGGLTRLVDRLINAGFVERRADPDDRRILRVALTTAGWDKLSAASTTHVEQLEEELFARLEPSEVQELERLLDKLR